jgi:hypothetical protein
MRVERGLVEQAGSRELRRERLTCEFAVIGGGLSGVCAAVTAARAGLRVILAHDRPVLGGNASSEVRLWILGATSHMGNNNRWAREGGFIDELLVENLYRNPEGNPVLLDALLLEKVAGEPNVTLLLNTAVFGLEKGAPDEIRRVRAFCSQNATEYEIDAPLFCDASGDGIAGFLSGAAFRVGEEPRAQFGEGFAPAETAGDCLGHTIYFYSKDAGRPVTFVPPAFALKDIGRIPRWRDIRAGDFGCRFWWLEWGGTRDTVHESEAIKWELWKVVYGVWNHIKNSGLFPDAATHTLEWVGAIPGKRESRRFVGDYVLTQADIVEQRRHDDAVSFGGWAIDVHPAEGVFSPQPGCEQWHAKGVYPIPYRALYARDVANLFLAGRLISASHVAFASTRVMATCAHGGQAVGLAAARCVKEGVLPRELLAAPRLAALQRELLKSGQHIPGLRLDDPADLARAAALSASSELRLARLEPGGETLRLTDSWGMMLPVQAGPMPRVALTLDVAAATTLRAELRVSAKPENHTPEVTLAALDVPLQPGRDQAVPLLFAAEIDAPRYAFVCLMKNEAVAVRLSDRRVTGVLAVCHAGNKAVAKSATQTPPPDSGIDTFEFWTSQRRPGGKNFALAIDPPLACFGVASLKNGVARPTGQPNAWVAAFEDARPSLRLSWPAPQRIARIELWFDTDFDHPMESVLMGHPERVMPFCVREAEVVLCDGAGGQTVARVEENHHSRCVIRLPEPVSAAELEVRLAAPGANVPAALFDVRCYE